MYPLINSTWNVDEHTAICRVLDSGRLTMGPEVKAFEDEFARYFGVKHAVMVNSGSSANLVAVAALCHTRRRPLKRGDEVIVPTLSWATTYHPLQQYGLKLVFVDIDPLTLNIDTKQVAQAITARTRAVIAVNILGNPCALGYLRRLCSDRGLILFEDNCESMGASFTGQYCGTWGHVGTFSTFYSHHLSTMEGGMIVTESDEIDQLARIIRNHGWTRDVAPAADFDEAYRFVMPGYNVRPLELTAAVGRVQLPKLAGFLEQRRKNAALFVRLFGHDDRFTVQREHGLSSWFAFTFVLKPGIDRNRVFDALRAAEIEFRMITGGCFLRHPAIGYFDYEVHGEIVHANAAHDRGFFVGNHPTDLSPQLLKLREVLSCACS